MVRQGIGREGGSKVLRRGRRAKMGVPGMTVGEVEEVEEWGTVGSDREGVNAEAMAK